ncbi:hypothetical protein [Gibbsiella quercinecans]|uniref:hypothetical protein n=1 Tax=Gibbsiella quercinecans TaxID=929813 RepID=UPI002433315D|nr:hypothetical protein [Gibbsiella quercinecans]
MPILKCISTCDEFKTLFHPGGEYAAEPTQSGDLIEVFDDDQKSCEDGDAWLGFIMPNGNVVLRQWSELDKNVLFEVMDDERYSMAKE